MEPSPRKSNIFIENMRSPIDGTQPEYIIRS